MGHVKASSPAAGWREGGVGHVLKGAQGIVAGRLLLQGELWPGLGCCNPFLLSLLRGSLQVAARVAPLCVAASVHRNTYCPGASQSMSHWLAIVAEQGWNSGTGKCALGRSSPRAQRPTHLSLGRLPGHALARDTPHMVLAGLERVAALGAVHKLRAMPPLLACAHGRQVGRKPLAEYMAPWNCLITTVHRPRCCTRHSRRWAGVRAQGASITGPG